MRTLKKTLCLVLCLVMMAGLCVIGASAAELTDADQIVHKEAVSVLGAIKVIEGYEDGSFRPTNELTRAEGAAIMTRLLAATVPSGTKSSFTDMGAAEWAQPYVAYCEAMGIINGYGDGRFGPNDKLTTAQFAKMLICALGYDANREQLTGNAWEIGVAKLVNATGLSAKIADFNYGANVTRDAAAQMAFNTLTAVMVDYQGNNLTVDASGNLAAPRRNLPNTTYDYDASLAPGNDGVMEFCENYFPTLKLDDTGFDKFGVSADKWFFGKDREDTTYDDNKLVAEAMNATVLATYTTTAGRLKLGTLYTDAKWTGAAGEYLTINENGHGQPGAVEAANQPVKNDTVTGLKTSNNEAPAAGFSGATVYLLDTTNNGKGDTLVVQYPYLAQVTKITEAAKTAEKTRQATLKVWNKAAPVTVTYETNDFAAQDWILVYPDANIVTSTAWAAAGFGTLGANIIKAEKATVVSGTATKYGTLIAGEPLSLTVSDVAYFKGSGALGFNYTTPQLNTSVALYLSNGAALGWAATTAAASDYVFVLGNDGGTTSAFGGTTYEVGYLKQDGTTATAKATFANAAAANAISNTWCTMTPVGSLYNFATAPAAAAGNKFGADYTQTTNATISSATPGIGGTISTNDKTVFLIKTKNAPATYKAYEGIKSLPTYNAAGVAGKTIYALNNLDAAGNATTAAAVYIDLNGISPADAKSAAIYLVSKTPAGTAKVDNVNVYTYNVIKDGALTTIESRTDLSAIATLPAYGVIIPEFDASGRLTGQSLPNTAQYPVKEVPITTAIKSGAGVITVEGSTYSVDADCAVYIYDHLARTLMVGDAGDLDAVAAGTISMITVSTTNSKIKTVYLYK